MHSQDSNSDMAIQWTDDDKSRLCKREVIIFKQNIMKGDLDLPGLPNDIHRVDYIQDGENYCDAVRAGKMSDIFDAYYDRLKDMGDGTVISIKSGYGTIKPKLYNPDQKVDKKS